MEHRGPLTAVREGRTVGTRMWGAFLVCLLLACALNAVQASPALAQEAAPHVVPAGETDTDVCAMCHRSHSSSSDTSWTDSFGITHASALLVGVPTGTGDSGLCYVCHGTELLGSQIDVLTAFSSASSHTLLPTVAEYGPAQKQCSSCHDSHGYERKPDGSTYTALLRSTWSTEPATGIVYDGDGYCATCHPARTGQRWSGLGVFADTAHGSNDMTAPTGTDIRCSACHDPHGSDISPLITSQVVPPAAAATYTVDGNDRSLCFACHLGSVATYGGKLVYDGSAHGLATTSGPVPAAWASVDATRAVGECQTCHAPMGRPDGSGGAIPELLETAGRDLCDRCHDADGPASDDVSSTAVPTGSFDDLEILVSIVPSTPTAYEDRLASYSAETSGSEPLNMVGPREYEPSIDMGPIAAGDIDGDGDNDLIVADRDTAVLDIVAYDALRGLDDQTGAGSLAIAAVADLVVVADVILDASGRPEIAVVDASAGQLRLYRYTSGSLTLVDGPISVGTDPSSLASGDVTGTVAYDLIVTAQGDDTFRILTESSGSLSAKGPFSTRSGPRGASTGDAWTGGTKDEIVIVNSGESTGTVSVFGGNGTALGHADDSAPAGAVPYASVVVDVLPGTTTTGTSGDEVSVVYRNQASGGTSAVDVFVQLQAGGLDTPLGYTTGADYNSGTLASGDVDGDGRDELIVGNGGRWARDTSRQAPSIQVLRANTAGTALLTSETLWSGGSELAGEPPALVVADLGGVGRSRHPVGGEPDVHVSTEGSAATRHVECPDCHAVHEATSTVSAAPAAYGLISGTWGVSVTNVAVDTITYTEKRGIDNEYELCFKCHSGWATLDGARNLAFEFNPLNPGEHAVEETSTDAAANAGSYVTGWGNDSVLFCKDCHGMSVSTETTGPHASNEAPLLTLPYLGARTIDTDLICYACHKYSVYYSGSDDATASASLFRDEDLGSRTKLHAYHSGTQGVGCAACHTSHGNPLEQHLIRDEMSFAHAASGGSCAPDCHTSSATHSYVRP